MIFLKEISTLQEETGEVRLGKAIARIMKGEKFNQDSATGAFNGSIKQNIY